MLLELGLVLLFCFVLCCVSIISAHLIITLRTLEVSDQLVIIYSNFRDLLLMIDVPVEVLKNHVAPSSHLFFC